MIFFFFFFFFLGGGGPISRSGGGVGLGSKVWGRWVMWGMGMLTKNKRH